MTLACGTVVFVNMDKMEWWSTAVAVVAVKKRQTIKLSAALHRRVKFNFYFDGAFIMLK